MTSRLCVFILALLLPWTVEGYEVSPIADGARITGQVRLQGTAPPPQQLPIAKDPEVCGSGSRDFLEVKVSPQGGLREVVVFLEEVAQGKAWTPSTEGYVLDQRQCEYKPYVLVVPKGQELTILNSDPVLHNIHTYEIIGKARRTLFNLAQPTMRPKLTRNIQTRRSNIVRVECDAHNFMLGWLFVADNPYYALVDQDGRFTIDQVPPGTYRLKAWHPFLEFQEQPVTVTSKGQVEVTFTYQTP